MKQYEGYKLVEKEDLNAAIAWAAGIKAEDPEKEADIALLRDVLTTGLTYARVVADNMGGLPCFDANQTPQQRQAAMAAAAKLARRPDGKKGRR